MKPYELRDTLIRINDVSLSFGEKVVLSGITAEVRDIIRPNCTQGQVIGILGPSGIGKTQLSRILTGLQEPTTGSVTIGAANTPIRAGLCGYVPQNYPLLRHRTVLGNLMTAASRGSKPEEAEARSMDFLKRFDLADKWDVYPAQLSGGQRQRIAIAQQLLCSEHFLILDEPTTGLDPMMKDRVCKLIQQVSCMSEENTIFLVSHDVAAVLSVADRLWLMGRKRNEAGQSLGAGIVQQYDLIERGIAWEDKPQEMPAFHNLLREIRAKFEEL